MNVLMSLPVLAILLFIIGLIIILIKKNLIMILIGIELMLNSANLNFIAFSSYRADSNGQLMILFILIIAVCEASLGLAIALRVYRFYHTSATNQISELKE